MNEVRRIRRERGLSQQRLAELAGVNKVTLVHVETGKTSPNVDTLEKLAAALECELADFFPKAQASLFEDRPEQEEEERLLIRLRPLMLLMDSQASYWQRELDRGTVTPEVYEEAIAQRDDVMEALERLLEALTAEDGLQWDNALHKPSRRVRRALEVAFIQWSRAWTALADAYGEEVPVSTSSSWFTKAA